jgi:serine/threonine-protein kinase
MIQFKSPQELRPADKATVHFPGADGVSTQPKRKCRVDLVRGGSQSLNEFEQLLRGRLRIVAAIFAVAFTVFFVRNLLAPTEPWMMTTPCLVCHTGIVVTTVVMALMLWSPVHLCATWLRYLELAVFGVPAIYFGMSQYQQFHSGPFQELLGEEHAQRLIRLAAAAAVLRWFCLAVSYGTFIPNTAKRCALVVAFIALIPLAINSFVAFTDARFFGYWEEMILDTVIIMGIASAIAIFGSYKISSLRQEASEAKKLGQYRLIEKLGAGGMGEVHLAEHLLLRRPCAVKLIRPEQAGDPANLARFEREVRATATLTHWNTVEIFDYGNTADGTFYYVMEYLPGLSLQDLVEKYGPIEPERVIHFLRQVCGALREAHGIGLIHRDIKPSNIIAGERGGLPDVAKLLDFGLVQKLSLGNENRLTLVGTIVGSPTFMSPEQAAGKEHIDARSDIYSLGGVAYFLLTGKAPFERETAMQMLLAHAHDAVEEPTRLRPDVPADLQEVVLRCLEKEPARRFQDALSLEKALANCHCASAWTEERAAKWWKERELARTTVSTTGPTVLYEPATA